MVIIQSLSKLFPMKAAIRTSGCTHPWRGITEKLKIYQSTMLRVNRHHLSERKQSWYIAIIWSLIKVISNVISKPNEWLQSSVWRNHRKFQNILINNSDGKWCHCDEKKTIMIYGDNTITQQISSNLSSDPNKWLHSWAMREPIKITKKTVDNGDGETSPFLWEKKSHR